jgi:hypothetical protein
VNHQSSANQFQSVDLERPLDDTVTLMVQGVPVTVNPESMMRTDTMGRAHLGVELEVGYNTEPLLLAQTKARSSRQEGGEMERPIDDTVTLMVEGVPVVVNPESMLKENTEARTMLGLQLEVGYNTQPLNLVQIDSQVSAPDASKVDATKAAQTKPQSKATNVTSTNAVKAQISGMSNNTMTQIKSQ